MQMQAEKLEPQNDVSAIGTVSLASPTSSGEAGDLKMTSVRKLSVSAGLCLISVLRKA